MLKSLNDISKLLAAPRNRLRIAVATLFLTSCLVFVGSLPNDFVLDDFPAVVNHPGAHWPIDARSVCLTNYWGNADNYKALTIYRPLATLTFALTDKMGGRDSPGCHRLINIVMHAGCTILVFFILLRLLVMPVFGAGFRPSNAFAIAFGTALIYGVHPVHSEAVIAVVSRAELMAAFLVLLGTWLLLLKPRRLVVWLPVVYAAALLSKENGATLWGIVIAWHFLCLLNHKTAQRQGFRFKDLRVHGGMLVVLVAYLGLRGLVLPGILAGDLSPADNPMVGGDLITRVLTPMKVFLEYLRLLISPAELTIDYSLNHFQIASGIFDFQAWSGLLIFAFVIVCAGCSIKKHPGFSFLVAAFLATYSVVSNIPFLSTIIMAERLVYLPSAFFLGLLAFPVAIALETSANLRAGRLLAISAAVVFVLFSARTIQRNGDWSDALTLYRAAVETAPQSAKSRHLLANEWMARAKPGKAIEHYRVAASIDRGNFVLQTNFARALAATGSFPEALKVVGTALAINPGYAPAHYVRCGIAERTGHPKDLLDLCHEPDFISRLRDRAGHY